MGDSLIMCSSESFGYRQDYSLEILSGKRAKDGQITQSSATNPLKNKKGNVINFVDIMDSDNVGMTQGSERFGFAAKSFVELGVGTAGMRNELQRDVAAELSIVSTVDDAHPALAGFTKDAKTPKEIASI